MSKILKVDFAEEFPQKKNHDCCTRGSMMKKYFFSKRKVEMHYSKRDKMIMMPLFAYNIYYVVILLSFLRHPNLGGITAPYLNKNVTSSEETTRSQTCYRTRYRREKCQVRFEIWGMFC